MADNDEITKTGPLRPDAKERLRADGLADQAKEIAAPAQYDFWNKAAEKAEEANKSGKKYHVYDHAVFKDEYKEKDMLKNDSFLHASEVLYDKDHGQGAWDKKVSEEGWSPEQARTELADEGVTYISEFNYQMYDAAEVALTIDKWKPEQQIAMLYMMQSYDHKNISVDGFGRGIRDTFTDPVNLGMIAAGFGLAAFTGGGSLALMAAGLAGRTGLTKIGSSVFGQFLKKSVEKIVLKETRQKIGQAITAKVSEKALEKGVMGAVARTGIQVGKAATSDYAKRAGRIGLAEGAISNYAIDRYSIYGVEESAGFSNEYGFMRGALAAGGGAGFGWGMGRGFPGLGGLGRGLRTEWNNSIRPAFSNLADSIFPTRMTQPLGNEMGAIPLGPSGAKRKPLRPSDMSKEELEKFLREEPNAKVVGDEFIFDMGGGSATSTPPGPAPTGPLPPISPRWSPPTVVKNKILFRGQQGKAFEIPIISQTKRLVHFTQHLAVNYKTHMSRIFDGNDSVMAKGESISQELGDVAKNLGNGSMSRTNAETRVADLETAYDDVAREFQGEISGLKGKLKEIQDRLGSKEVEKARSELQEAQEQLSDLKSNKALKADIIRQNTEIDRLKENLNQAEINDGGNSIKPKEPGFGRLKYWAHVPFQKVTNEEITYYRELQKLVEKQVRKVERRSQISHAAFKNRTRKIKADINNSVSVSNADLSARIQSAADALKNGVKKTQDLVGHNDHTTDPMTIIMRDTESKSKRGRIFTFKDQIYQIIDDGAEQERERFLRSIREKLVNPHKRLTEIVRSMARDHPDNAEALTMDLEDFRFSRLTGDTTADSKTMGHLLLTGYSTGNEHEYLYALRHFFYAMGRDPRIKYATAIDKNEYFPSETVAYMNEKREAALGKGVTLADDHHFNAYVKRIEDMGAKEGTGHSPEPVWYAFMPNFLGFGSAMRAQREIYQRSTMMARYSIRFRYADLVATPGTVHYRDNRIWGPIKSYFKRQFDLDYLSGKAIDSVETKKNKITARKNPTDNKRDYTQNWKYAFKERTGNYQGLRRVGTAISRFPLIAWPAKLTMTPLYPGYLISKNLVMNKYFGYSTAGLALGGGILTGVEELAEYKFGEENKSSLWFNDKGELIIPGTNIDVDLGSRAAGLAIQIADTALKPMEWGAGTVEWAGEKAFGWKGIYNSGITSDVFSLDENALSPLNWAGGQTQPFLNLAEWNAGNHPPIAGKYTPFGDRGADDYNPETPEDEAAQDGGGEPTDEEKEEIEKKEKVVKDFEDKGLDNLTDDETLTYIKTKEELDKAKSDGGTKGKKTTKDDEATPADTLAQLIDVLKKGKTVVGKYNIDGKTDFLKEIDESIAALENNPNATAKQTAGDIKVKIDNIKGNVNKTENLADIEEALISLKKQEDYAIDREEDAKKLEEIKEVRKALLEAKADLFNSPRTADGTLKALKDAYKLTNELAWTEAMPSELRDKKNPLYRTFNNAWSVVTIGGGEMIGKGKSRLKRIWDGKEGATSQSVVKWGGGILAAIIMVKTVGKMIPDWPVIGTLMRIALFVGSVWAAVKLMENSMNTKAAIQHSRQNARDKQAVLTASNVPNNGTTASMTNSTTGEVYAKTMPIEQSASAQGHKDGSTPKLQIADPVQNEVLSATLNNAGQSSSQACQGTGCHLDKSNHGGIGLIASNSNSDGSGGNNLPREITHTQNANNEEIPAGALGIIPHGDETIQEATIIPFENIQALSNELAAKPASVAKIAS